MVSAGAPVLAKVGPLKEASIVYGKLSDTERLYDCVAQTDRRLHVVKGATHYYAGQPDKLAEAAGIVTTWLVQHGFHA